MSFQDIEHLDQTVNKKRPAPRIRGTPGMFQPPAQSLIPFQA
jgi:hypothetical protein